LLQKALIIGCCDFGRRYSTKARFAALGTTPNVTFFVA
jgi:hypothetical protein